MLATTNDLTPPIGRQARWTPSRSDLSIDVVIRDTRQVWNRIDAAETLLIDPAELTRG